MKKMSIKQGDKVIVLNGKDKGKIGEVLQALPREGKVVVQGVNVCSRHTKPRQMGDEGGIIQKEVAIYACKVMRVCPIRPTSCWPTARKCASARSAARKSEERSVIYYACFEGQI